VGVTLEVLTDNVSLIIMTSARMLRDDVMSLLEETRHCHGLWLLLIAECDTGLGQHLA